ncbi:hypothetical protein [Streptomyces sp. NBC_01320]|nr:hypothetical protein OG395_57790 [Streptomyces sp. NBC_01320]
MCPRKEPRHARSGGKSVRMNGLGRGLAWALIQIFVIWYRD